MLKLNMLQDNQHHILYTRLITIRLQVINVY